MTRIQRLFFKLFRWRITIKIEKMSQEERAKFLLNELIKTVQKGGHSFASQKDFGSASIWLHNMGSENAILVLERIGKWSISTKPDFNLKPE